MIIEENIMIIEENNFKILKEIDKYCFNSPLVYKYSSFVGIDTGSISKNINILELKEDLNSIYQFYSSEIYKKTESMSSLEIDTHLLIYPPDLNIWVFLNMYEKENPGVISKFNFYNRNLFDIDDETYSIEKIQEVLYSKIKSYSRFSGEFIDNETFKENRLDEIPILNPEDYSEDYLIKYYTFTEFPSFQVLNKIAYEFEEYSKDKEEDDLMSSTRFLVDNRKSLYKKVINNLSRYTPDCIKLFMSFFYKTI